MRRVSRLVICTLLAFVPIACSSGGGGGDGGASPPATPAAEQWIGTWDLVAPLKPTECNPNSTGNPLTATITISITGTGADTRASFFSPGIQVPVVNGRIEGYSSFNLTTYDWELTGPDTFTGTQSSNTLTSTCPVVRQVTGTRVSN